MKSGTDKLRSCKSCDLTITIAFSLGMNSVKQVKYVAICSLIFCTLLFCSLVKNFLTQWGKKEENL